MTARLTELPRHAKDISGRLFGRWSVVGFAGTNKHRQAVWDCVCKCGEKRQVTAQSLLSGASTSCGCLRIETITTHGQTHSLTYGSWKAMIFRCTKESSKDFQSYGAKGILVCERWLSFDLFFKDMGERPEGTTIDRIDNSIGYEPTNCRWATYQKQTHNRKTNVRFTVNGETLLTSEWAKKLGVGDGLIPQRLKSGWSVVDACTTPPRKYLSKSKSLQLEEV